MKSNKLMLMIFSALSLTFTLSANAEVYKCTGTEPFWALNIDTQEGTVTYASPNEDQAVKYNKELSLLSSPNDGRVQSFSVKRKQRFKKSTSLSGVLIDRNGDCSDGMSDLEYPYEIIINGAAPLVGCCQTASRPAVDPYENE